MQRQNSAEVTPQTYVIDLSRYRFYILDVWICSLIFSVVVDFYANLFLFLPAIKVTV